jgi:hypothetical protein
MVPTTALLRLRRCLRGSNRLSSVRSINRAAPVSVRAVLLLPRIATVHA